MKLTLVLVGILIVVYIITEFAQKDKSEFEFMSRTHTTVIKGLGAILVILQHVGNALGTRLTTPLGGTGVAMFLIVSGYGLNESYKSRLVKNIAGGVLEKQVSVGLLAICNI